MSQLQMSKLIQWMQPKSVNQLSGVSPLQLKNQLGISEIEVVRLVEELHKKRLLTYRYKFICETCGNSCNVYERVLNAGSYSCGECGREISFNDIKGKCEVIYELKKGEILKIGNNSNVDFTQKAIENSVVNLSVYKKEKKEIEKLDTKTIFFGSSSEAIKKMECVAAVVGSQGMNTMCWNSPNLDVFSPTETTIDNLIETAEQVDAAVFVFNADDKTWFKNTLVENTVRDNVLFEYGLFMGKLGKTNVLLACDGNPHIPSDLAGITYIDLSKDEAVWSQSLKGWLRKIK